MFGSTNWWAYGFNSTTGERKLEGPFADNKDGQSAATEAAMKMSNGKAVKLGASNRGQAWLEIQKHKLEELKQPSMPKAHMKTSDELNEMDDEI